MPHSRPSGLQLFLDRLLSRSVLNSQEQDAILGLRSQAMLATRNTDIVDYSETVDHACLVGDGIVGSFGCGADGRRQITSFFVSGDMVDLHSVVAPRSGQSLQALAPSTILRIRHADLRALAMRYPAIAEAFWRDCVVDAAIFAQWVVNVGSRDAATRTAHLLCELGVRLERAGIGMRERFPLTMTQTHLGDALGLTPVHVNRTLRSLRERALLSLSGSEVIVDDWPRLAETGDFDAHYLQLDVEPVRYGYFGRAEAAR
jgi:CRP-like cAMP-binding protein